MAWIESHQALREHPKTKKAARLLGMPRIHLVGHLHGLWWWAMEYAESGDLTGIDVPEIADAAEWQGDPEQFVAVLEQAGFIDADGQGRRVLHDWDDYAGRLLERRRTDAERKRRSRERPQDIRGTSAGQRKDSGVTVTLPEPKPSPRPETRTPGGDSAAAAAPPALTPLRKASEPTHDATLLAAFEARGLRPPPKAAGEVAAAKKLLREYTADEIVGYWQDVASGDYGDDWDRRNLSFVVFGKHNRLGSWVALKASGGAGAIRAGPRRNGNTPRQAFTSEDAKQWDRTAFPHLEIDDDDAPLRETP